MPRTRDSQRQQVIEALSLHLLRNGLSQASLRQLAAAAGTSDRMLLYYFNDKTDLMTTVLSHAAGQMQSWLDQTLTKPLPPAELLARLAMLSHDAETGPYLRLWLEMAVLAGRNLEPFRKVAQEICNGLHQWIATRLRIRNETQRLPQAALLVATLEGLILLHSVGCEPVATAALDYHGRGRSALTDREVEATRKL